MTDNPEIRLNKDGSVDEIIADGVSFHLEQMDNGAWWKCCKPMPRSRIIRCDR